MELSASPTDKTELDIALPRLMENVSDSSNSESTDVPNVTRNTIVNQPVAQLVEIVKVPTVSQPSEVNLEVRPTSLRAFKNDDGDDKVEKSSKVLTGLTSWHESLLQIPSTYSSGELADLFELEFRLERGNSITANSPRRSNGSRRARRCSSAREGSNSSGNKPKIRRSISERGTGGGEEDDLQTRSCSGGRRRQHHHHHHRKGSCKSNSKEATSSLYSLTSYSDRSTPRQALTRQKSISESVAVELGLATAPGVTPKESNRRRIVFAVVLISLAILTASVFLVAITLLLSPAVDAVLRKENEELLRVVDPETSSMSSTASFNRTDTVTDGTPG